MSDISNRIDRLIQCVEEFKGFHKSSVPLCAAENVISPFTKIPLSGDFQERYIMGSPYSYSELDNFIGSQYLIQFYSMLSEICRRLFRANYVDARTLSGMNCVTSTLMSLTQIGDKIALLPAEWGGHASMKPVCERLGLQVYDAPYCIHQFDLDYDNLNKMVEQEKVKFILLAPSDIIKPLDVNKLNLQNTTLLYDISQLMGLIAADIIKNPLDISDNIVLLGGTHKTLPGPTSGLILTNNKDIHHALDKNINPVFLRNPQMHQIISLLAALIEFEAYGKEYGAAIVATAKLLGEQLESLGFDLAKTGKEYSYTHQLFIRCSENVMNTININAIAYGVTLNKKVKPLLSGYGIRLGTQEIARYGWDKNAIITVALIMDEIKRTKPDSARISYLKSVLPPKIIQYTFPDELYQLLISVLHKY